MTNFNDLTYERVKYDVAKERVDSLLKKLKEANNYEDFEKFVREINNIQIHIEQMYDYADICNMRNNKDEYYNNEITYWNEYKPKFDLLFKPFYECILNSKYKNQLKEIMPINFFNSIEYNLKIQTEDIIELKQRENQLMKEYKNIIFSKVIYDEEEHNLTYIASFFSNQDRNVRKKAHDAYNDFYLQHQEQLNKNV